jgi:ribosomal protein S6
MYKFLATLSSLIISFNSFSITGIDGRHRGIEVVKANSQLGNYNEQLIRTLMIISNLGPKTSPENVYLKISSNEIITTYLLSAQISPYQHAIVFKEITDLYHLGLTELASELFYHVVTTYGIADHQSAQVIINEIEKTAHIENDILRNASSDAQMKSTKIYQNSLRQNVRVMEFVRGFSAHVEIRELDRLEVLIEKARKAIGGNKTSQETDLILKIRSATSLPCSMVDQLL